MASAQEIQTLLRFLSQDAKVPLAQALSKIKALQAAKLVTPPDIAKCELDQLQNIFEDEKSARQVLNAAKRVCKKRPSTHDASSPVNPAPSPKKARQLKPAFGQILNPVEFERSLALPAAEMDESKVQSAAVHTNRAPLVLAFAVTLLQYTMPDQPLSSRLSLAHAVVSANSQTKARNIGITSGKSAEDEGWGEGQPLVKIMGREIRVMKRWGYDPDEGAPQSTQSTQGTLEAEPVDSKEPALWGIDLEALKKSNKGVTAASYMPSTTQLPIFTAQSARAYLIKSFHSPKPETDSKAARKSNTAVLAEKERNLGLLLGALELLYQSWSSVLSKEELDKRAWGWYVRVRPEVASGAAGWGGKGDVKLSEILALRRPAD